MPLNQGRVGRMGLRGLNFQIQRDELVLEGSQEAQSPPLLPVLTGFTFWVPALSNGVPLGRVRIQKSTGSKRSTTGGCGEGTPGRRDPAAPGAAGRPAPWPRPLPGRRPRRSRDGPGGRWGRRARRAGAAAWPGRVGAEQAGAARTPGLGLAVPAPFPPSTPQTGRTRALPAAPPFARGPLAGGERTWPATLCR